MFGNNRREFSLLKQPKCKSEQMLLSLLKKWGCRCYNSLPPFRWLLVLSERIAASFWSCVACHFYPLDGLNDAWWLLPQATLCTHVILTCLISVYHLDHSHHCCISFYSSFHAVQMFYCVLYPYCACDAYHAFHLSHGSSPFYDASYACPDPSLSRVICLGSYLCVCFSDLVSSLSQIVQIPSHCEEYDLERVHLCGWIHCLDCDTHAGSYSSCLEGIGFCQRDLQKNIKKVIRIEKKSDAYPGCLRCFFSRMQMNGLVSVKGWQIFGEGLKSQVAKPQKNFLLFVQVTIKAWPQPETAHEKTLAPRVSDAVTKTKLVKLWDRLLYPGRTKNKPGS